MQIGLVEIIALLGTISGAVGYLFRALMEQKDRSYADFVRTSDQRYAEMMQDRDFWRREHKELQDTQVAMLVVVRDGVTAVRTAVTELVQQRQEFERRGAS